MLLRTIASIFMVAFMFLVFFLGKIAFVITISVFSVIAILELYKTAENKGYHPMKGVAPLFVLPLVLLGISEKLDYPNICFYGIASIVILVCLYQSKKYTIIDGAITIFFGVAVTSMFYSLLTIYQLGKNSLTSAALLLVTFLGSWATDIFAYLVGVTIGKHKLCPAISPKKSIEGSIGGILGAMLSMTLYCKLVLPHFIPAFASVPIWAFILLGFFCGIFSQVGDLTFSMVKRHFGVKDYGKFFPGHGGILDRFDSVFFVAPAVYFFLRVAVYVVERGMG